MSVRFALMPARPALMSASSALMTASSGKMTSPACFNTGTRAITAVPYILMPASSVLMAVPFVVGAGRRQQDNKRA